MLARYRAYRAKVVDGLVREATRHKSLKQLLESYNHKRIGKLATSWHSMSSSLDLKTVVGGPQKARPVDQAAAKAATPSGSTHLSWPEQAAIKIQAVARGNAVRRRKHAGTLGPDTGPSVYSELGRSAVVGGIIG